MQTLPAGGVINPDVQDVQTDTDRPPPHQPPPPQPKSPGLGVVDGLGPAFELKFQLTPAEAALVEDWARTRLTPDRNGHDGRYRVTSTYCDTSGMDVFHRSAGFRRSKFRLRTYNGHPDIFLERKVKRGTEVRKRRTRVTRPELPLLAEPIADADWAGDWFYRQVRRRALRPICCVSYNRTAFFGMAGASPVRMTIDTELVGVAADGWDVPHLEDGHALLPDAVLMEMKFHVQIPPLFRELLKLLPANTRRASKYRRCIEACGLMPAVAPPAAALGLPATPVTPVTAAAVAGVAPPQPAPGRGAL